MLILATNVALAILLTIVRTNVIEINNKLVKLGLTSKVWIKRIAYHIVKHVQMVHLVILAVMDIHLIM